MTTVRVRAQEGGLDSSWAGTDLGLLPTTLRIQANGAVLTQARHPDGAGGISLARLNPDGTLDTGFNPGKGPYTKTPPTVIGQVTIPGSTNVSTVAAIAAQTDGKALVGGPFNTWNEAPRAGVARLNPDGSVDTAFDPGAAYSGSSALQANVLEVAADGRIYLGGRSGKWGNTTYNRGLVRLNADGSVDTSFADSGAAPGTTVVALYLPSSGKVIAAEAGNSGWRVVRLNADGSLDSSFQLGSGAPLAFTITTVGTTPDAKVLVGNQAGGTYNGTPVKTFFRLAANGAVDTSVAPDVNGAVFKIVPLSDGRAYLGGTFSRVGTVAMAGVARLQPDGTPDTAFTPAPGVNGGGLAVQADGRVLTAATWFTNSQIRLGLVRLLATAGSQPVAPSIAQQPRSQTVASGAPVAFVVSAAGTPPLSYQWFHDSSPVPGATNATVNLNSAQPTDQGAYLVAVSNAVGSVVSAAATLTVLTPPAVTQQPQSQTVTAGGNVTFSVTATGSAPLAYQWQRNGGTLAGATNPTLALNNVQTAQAGDYSVVVTNAVGTTRSAPAALVVSQATPPVITLQPLSQTVAVGGGLLLSIAATGTPPLAFQWYHTNAPIAGATNTTLVLTAVQQADEGAYKVAVANQASLVFSDTATVSVKQPPTIAQQPQSQSVTAGANVGLSVTAAGSGPLAYQWNKNGTTLAGATNAALALNNVQVADAGNYTVVVTNVVGSVTSNPATLVVNLAATPPRITQQPLSLTAALGGAFALSVTAEGTAPLTYQWYRNGLAITSATNATLAVTSATQADQGAYLVAVGNSVGLSFSDLAGVVLKQPPALTQQPQGQTVTPGANVTFSVTATGDPPLAYQWNKDGASLTGATNATLALSNLQPADSGDYTVVVTNQVGSVTSNPATLAVNPPATAPLITQQPPSLTVTAGANVVLGVTASGTPPLGFQWQKNGGALSGATGQVLMLTNVQSADAASYTVVVSNTAGSVTSNPAILTVNAAPAPPTITQQPRSQTVATGAAVAFTVAATGAQPLSYQWRKNNVAVSGATNAALTLNNVQVADAASYAVVVANAVGSATSNPAVLAVNPTADCYATRALPGAYAPGAAFSVTNAVTAPPGTFTYGVEDQPPAGWSVTGISDSGVFDAINGKVKWTFLDGNNRALVYQVTPPANAQGAQTFSGMINLDGQNESAICGSSSVDLAQYHPADLKPADWRLGLSEVIGYAAAYLKGTTWTVSPNPIPLSYAIRSLFLYKRGEVYRFDTTAPSAPAWWVPTTVAAGAGGGGGADSGSGGGSGGGGGESAVSQLPASYTTGVPLTVSITVSLPSSDFAYGVEDQPPAGWTTIATISDSGAFDAINGKVKWTFLDHQGRTLTYQVTPPGNASGPVSFAGTASFDGERNLPVTGSRTIDAASLPVITQAPQSQTVTAGANVTFSVTATGAAPLRYVWQKNGGTIADATNVTLTLTSVKASDAASYTAVVSNAAGSVTSDPATLVVNSAATAPAITQQPRSQTVLAGTNVTLSVTATGTAPLAYQWQKNGVAVSGATNATLALASVKAGDAASYTVGVSNAAGSVTSTPATLVVNAATPPAITQQPQSQTVAAGANVAFAVTASGSLPLSYQWQKNGANVAGATGATLTLVGVQAADAGAYRVVVSNAGGTVTSGPAVLSLTGSGTPPAITQQPQSQAVPIGTNVTFSVAATGTAPLAYQWLKDGASLSGATSATLVLTGVQTANSGTYTVAVANVAGSVTSIPAVLTVNPAANGLVQVTIEPVGGRAAGGQWQLTTGPDTAWHNSSDTISVPAGDYVIAGKPIGAAWVTPTARTFKVTAGVTLSVTRTYAPALSGVTINVRTAAGAKDSEVVLPVRVQAFSNVLSLQFSLRWDPAVASYVGLGQEAVAGIVAAPGTGALRVSWDDPAGVGVTLADNTALFTVRLHLVGSPGTQSDVTVSGDPTPIEIVNGQGQLLPLLPLPGLVSVLSGAHLAGTVTYADQPRPVRGVSVSLSGDANQTVATGADGTYNFPGLASGSFRLTPTKADDTPAANGVTTLDIALIRRHVLSIAPLDSPLKLLAADVNNSGSISTLDLALIRRLVLGITNSLPGGLWRFVRANATFADPQNPWSADGTRSYTNLAGDTLGQDFAAIKLGDVNNSWVAPAGLLTEADGRPPRGVGLAGQNPAPPVGFQLGSASAGPGETATVGITVAQFTQVTTAQFTLQWDPAVLQFAGTGGYGLQGLTAASFGTTLTNSGKLAFSWDDPNVSGVTLPDGSTLFTLSFRVAGAAGGGSAVAFVDAPAPREVSVSFAKGEFQGSNGAVAVRLPAAITEQPQAQIVLVGGTASFAVTAVGTPPLSYQWRKDGFVIPDATNSSFTIPNASLLDAGTYTVVVANPASSVTSDAAALQVTTTPTEPVITRQPQSQTLAPGQRLALSVAATGTAPLSFQWYHNDVPIPGATAPVYAVDAAKTSDAGNYIVIISNPARVIWSDLAVVTVQQPPVITKQPLGQTVAAGTNVLFSVVATGTPPLAYQWKKEGANLPGAASPVLTLANVQPSAAGSYTVVVSNSGGSVASAAAVLVVNPGVTPPAITQQPQSQTVSAGATVVFTVAATGAAPLAYQWRKDGVDISGAVNQVYTLAAVQTAAAGSYTVVVSNAAGNVTSAAAVLVVNPGVTAPTITQQPQSQTVLAGTTVLFTVAASGATPLSYQWRKDGGDIAGAVNPVYTVIGAQSAAAGSYSVVVSNAGGSVVSAAAVLTVTSGVTPPAITQQPQSQTVLAGATVVFTVTATGATPLAYQWKKDGVNLANATNPALTLSAVTSLMAGTYTVVVSNSGGTVTSAAAVLTVNQPTTPPIITQQPRSQTVALGGPLTLSVTATGAAPLVYQWYHDGAALPGATAATYSVNAATQSDEGLYLVSVANALDTVFSGLAVVSVQEAPAIVQQPQDTTVAAGATAIFFVSATGTAPLNYQWQKNGAVVSGAINPSLTLANAQVSDAATYAVVVNNAAGSVTSAPVVLTLTGIGNPPVITQQPQSQGVTVGGNALFTVAASSTLPLTYQWRKNGADLPGATSPSLSLPGVTANSAGDYTVLIKNAAGVATSNPATLTVNPLPVPPSITLQPDDLTVLAGTDAIFRVTAAGATPLSYQWKRNGVDIPGAVFSSLLFSAVQPADAGYLTVVVTNAFGSVTSRLAALIVNIPPNPPSILLQPQGRAVLLGANIALSVSVGGSLPLNYQWQKNGVNVAGATGPALSLPNIQLADAGSYTVTVSNGAGRVTSDPALIVVNLPPTVPVVTQQPQSQFATVGSSVTLTVVAAGTAPLGYQWRKNGADLPGATGSSFTIPNASVFDAGLYAVLVSNVLGSTLSDPAQLSVNPATDRQLRVGALSTNAVRQVLVPIELVSTGEVSSLSFSLNFNPNLLLNPQALVLVKAGDVGTLAVTPGTPLGRPVGKMGGGPSADLQTDTTLLGGGKLGLRLALSAGSHFLGGVRQVIGVRFDLAPGQNSQAEAALAFGSQPVPVQVSDPLGTSLPLQVLILPTLVEAGMTTKPDVQTGLFTDVITVFNPASTAAVGLRVLVRNLGADLLGHPIRVQNAAGTTNGIPYLQFGLLPAGGAVELLAEFYVSDRQTVPRPLFEVQILPPAIPALPGAGLFAVDYAVFTNGVFLVEFTTLSNRTYYVQYGSDVAAANWSTALPGVVGTGSRVQWVDNGPPKTDSKPSAQATRFYRVLLQP